MGGHSGPNSIRNATQASGQGSFRTNTEAAPKSALQAHQVTSSLPSAASGSNANSKGQKSAVSMASVMGQFESQPNALGAPNIFA